MDMNLNSCPSCGGMLYFASGSFPASSGKHGDKVETECPHCEEQILIGWVSEYRLLTPPAPDPEPVDTSASSGGGPGHGGSSANDDRSNTLNPNNPAHRAAQDNRANQLNPNSQAYRSSRGR